MRPLSGGRIFIAAKSIAPEQATMPISIPDPDARPSYYTMREFALLFGRERRWTKRLVDAGKIKAVTLGTSTRQRTANVQSFVWTLEARTIPKSALMS